MNNEKNAPSAPRLPTSKRVVLLVDDDKAVREYLRPALTTDTLSCITAGSVAQAIKALRDNDIALMVLDWGLDRCGAEVVREARETRPNMPVLAMSGLPYEVRTDVMMQKVDAFLQKPLSGEVLNRQVMQLLERVADTPPALFPKTAGETRPLGDVKALYIRHVVRLFENNISMAAKALGIHRQTVAAALEQDELRDKHPRPKPVPSGVETQDRPVDCRQPAAEFPARVRKVAPPATPFRRGKEYAQEVGV